MRRILSASLTLLGLCLILIDSTAVSADVVKYAVSGTIDENQDATLYPGISVGDSFSGFFAYDDSIVGVKSGSPIGDVYSFQHPGGWLGASFTVNGQTFQGNTGGSPYSPQLFDDFFATDSLVYLQEAVPLAGHEGTNFRVHAEFVGPTTMFSIPGNDPVNLPGTMTLGDWTTKREVKFGVSTSTGVMQFIRGEIDVMETFTGGDYNMDGSVDQADVDLQSAAMKDASPDLLLFDENDDGLVNFDDRLIWIRDHANSWVGDSDLDHEFGSGDLVTVFTAGEYETGQMATWAEGDWDGNMLFDSSDLVAAFTDGGYEQGPPMMVPEPSGMALSLICLTAFCLRLSRSRRTLSGR